MEDQTAEKAASLAYLANEEARDSVLRDPYWPKWNSPWWHLSLLHELGADSQVPPAGAGALLEAMRGRYIAAFFPEEFPADKNSVHDAPCFCGIGTIFPALEAAGFDPDAALPWARDWMMKHAMPSGGLNCFPTHYREGVPGSSIVATVAALELFIESREGPRNEAEIAFVHGLARDLLERKLLYAFPDTSNSEERADEADWKLLCFPRFYFYDALRGLTAITRYAERMKTAIPGSAIVEAVDLLALKGAEGPLRIERDALSAVRSLVLEAGEWVRSPSSESFPLLRQVSRVGDVSPSLETEWQETRRRIKRIRAAGLIKT